MNSDLFGRMMDDFKEAVKYRKGRTAHLRISRLATTRPKYLSPSDIRKIRRRLGVSQPLFARYLGTSLGAVRSWEQGARRPQSTALRLLTIAKKNPAVLLASLR
jgi:putative transcriptional regulator